MAPKSKTKKTSYVLSSDAFNLKCWNGAVRLNEFPSLAYRAQDHLFANARAGLVNFTRGRNVFRMSFYQNVHENVKEQLSVWVHAHATRLHAYMDMFMRMCPYSLVL